MALYRIKDIEFDPFEFYSKIDEIIKTFRQYNSMVQDAVFDSQFLSMQLLKYEARHSNKIEGIETNDIELLAADSPTSKKISNYVSSLKKADDRLLKENVFSTDLILQIHRDLFENMMSTDAIHANPGNFRIKYVKIANHMPPDPMDVETYINELVEWLNDPKPFEGCTPVVEALVRGSIAHAYFEKIHPFTDGNGRAGRILFNLVLNKYRLTSAPYFYISKAILHDQYLYYQELARLDNSKNFQSWIRFFLSLVLYQLKSNIKTLEAATTLTYKIKMDIFQEPDPILRSLKRVIMDYISKYPIFTFTRVYYKIKPQFDNIENEVFVRVFDEIIEKYDIYKIPNTKYYEFKKLVDIIVGKDW